MHGFYRIGKVIGDGNFAVVRECKNRYVYLPSVIYPSSLVRQVFSPTLL